MFWFRKKEIKNENDSIHLGELLKLREECNRFFLSCYSSNIHRSQLIITKLEQKVNEQQVEIFKLKKKIKLFDV